ncbi:hypothetical protein [Nonomuraea typhae]|uniref:hypothetical protein n=1 Tax=Nonomuraea typhae TaxID=2603600 RepID=UPI0012F7CEE0|nr:hypothetical protein [Nonomuraea typhae]
MSVSSAGTSASCRRASRIAVRTVTDRRLSAAFAHQRLRRALAGGVRYVTGGWSTLVELLAGRATGLGVRIRTRTRVSGPPEGPAILATSLTAARRLTGDGSLTWPGARTATVNLGLRAGGGPDWFRVLDLDDRIYAARYSLADPTLAPPGHELLQISAACAPDERKADAERPPPSSRPVVARLARCGGNAAPSPFSRWHPGPASVSTSPDAAGCFPPARARILCAVGMSLAFRYVAESH